MHLTLTPANVCGDCFSSQPYMKRVMLGLDFGAMLGTAETSDGDLGVEQLYNLDIRYRLGSSDRTRIHAGLRMATFIMRGPYRHLTLDGWREDKPQFVLIGPALWFTF